MTGVRSLGGAPPHALASEAPCSAPHSGDSLPPAPPLSCSRTSRRGRGGGETLVRALVDTMAIFPTYYQPARRVASGPSCHPLCARIKNRKKNGPHCPIRRHPRPRSFFHAQEPSDDGDSHERMNAPHIYYPFSLPFLVARPLNQLLITYLLQRRVRRDDGRRGG